VRWARERLLIRRPIKVGAADNYLACARCNIMFSAYVHVLLCCRPSIIFRRVPREQGNNTETDAFQPSLIRMRQKCPKFKSFGGPVLRVCANVRHSLL
jgi:hypothetical protein